MKAGRSMFKKALGRSRRFFICGARSRMICVSCAGVAVARSAERASFVLGEERTRSAPSVGGYLLSDPRRNNARSAVEFALASLADLSAAVFVDLVRLLNVAGG